MALDEGCSAERAGTAGCRLYAAVSKLPLARRRLLEKVFGGFPLEIGDGAGGIEVFWAGKGTVEDGVASPDTMFIPN